MNRSTLPKCSRGVLTFQHPWHDDGWLSPEESPEARGSSDTQPANCSAGEPADDALFTANDPACVGMGVPVGTAVPPWLFHRGCSMAVPT
jgi:hypothetical protein